LRIRLRFLIGAALVVGALIFFGLSGFQEGKAYYLTLAELRQMGSDALGKRLRIAGTVQEGSIEHRGEVLAFELRQENLSLPVVYTGTSPVPDTFKGGVEAVVSGQMRDDGTFEAYQIQAKCASKYEARYGSSGDSGGE